MPVLDEYEYGWEDPRLEGMLVEMMASDRERQRDARIKAKVDEYSRSFKVSYSELGLPEPRTDWRYRLGQWLIQVGKRVCNH